MTTKEQKHLIFLCWFVYFCAYIGRYSYNTNITLIESVLQVKHADSGMVTTFFCFAYGVGQVVNGIFCKKYKKRILLFCSLTISAVLNLLVFFNIPFVFMKYVWFLNGAALSVLWSSLVTILSENVDEKYINRAILFMSMSSAMGTVASYALSALFALSGTYRYSFFFAGLVLILAALYWVFAYKAVPQAPTLVAPVESEQQSEKRKASKSIIALVCILSLFAVITCLIRDGIYTWVPSILKETYGLPDSLSILLTFVLPVLGVFGTTMDMLLRKKIKDFVLLAGMLFFVAVLCILGVIFLLNTSLWGLILLLFGLVILFMHGISGIITSIAPLYMRDRLNSGRLSGILNGFCYLGSMISSYGLGAVADANGWQGVFILLLILGCVAIVIQLIYTVCKLLLSKRK